jgi:hypothetical protein
MPEPEPCPVGVEPSLCPYEPNPAPPSWWRDGIDTIEWNEERSGDTVLWYTKVSVCPRCHHQGGISISKSATGWAGVAPAGIRDAEDNEVFTECECLATHEGRPKEVEKGCGYQGYVAGPVSPAQANVKRRLI